MLSNHDHLDLIIQNNDLIEINSPTDDSISIQGTINHLNVVNDQLLILKLFFIISHIEINGIFYSNRQFLSIPQDKRIMLIILTFENFYD